MNKANKSPIYVILDNIRSALNVGAIFRTCDAANVKKLMLCGITAYPPHNRIPKTALGATESVSWERYDSTLEAIKTVRQSLDNCRTRGQQSSNNSITIVAIELTPSAVSLWNYNFTAPTALVFGNEITGVSKEVQEASDAVVKVPMFGQKESLNVATTVGIVTYEVLRKII